MVITGIRELKYFYKEKTKRWYDKHLIKKESKERDSVLLYNSHLFRFLGRLKSRWFGPFIVSKVFSYGTVEVTNPT